MPKKLMNNSRLNNKGSILQIVLIIFMVMILNIGLFITNTLNNSKAINQVKEINKARLLELTIIRYYKETILNDILLSDEITIDDYTVHYTVDDMGSYYYIVTKIEKNEQVYSFNLEINLKTLSISAFEYQ